MTKWMPVYGYEGFYEVSNLGEMRSVERVIGRKLRGVVWDKKLKSKPLKQADRRGYRTVTLCKFGGRENISVHRVVMLAFSGKRPEDMFSMQVNHKDCNRANNNIDNLEWCTAPKNVQHGITSGRMEFDEKSSKYNGVSFDKSRGMWRSYHKNRYIGHSESEHEASVKHDIVVLKEAIQLLNHSEDLENMLKGLRELNATESL